MGPILALALAAAVYPQLLAVVVVILTRPSPRLLLWACYLGGLCVSVGSSLAILAVFRARGSVADTTVAGRAHGLHGDWRAGRAAGAVRRDAPRAPAPGRRSSADPPQAAPQAHIRRSHRPHVSEQERSTLSQGVGRAQHAAAAGSRDRRVDRRPARGHHDRRGSVRDLHRVEAMARRLLSFLGSTLLLVATIGLGVGLVLLFLKHWRTAIAVLLGAAALTLLLGNLRDLRRG
jgi:hypothetical protein